MLRYKNADSNKTKNLGHMISNCFGAFADDAVLPNMREFAHHIIRDGVQQMGV
jgi:hypothetical protein